MAFAPHTNTDVVNCRRAGLPAPAVILGQFQEREHGHTFEFLARDESFAEGFEPAFTQMIACGDRSYRLADVRKTVAYVLVDEGVVQKWAIKNRRDYENGWIERESVR